MLSLDYSGRSIAAIFCWSLFMFSVIMMVELFTSPIVSIVLFNILSIGYIFYYSVQFDRFPNPGSYVFSLVIIHILFFLFAFLYGQIILFSGFPWLAYRTLFYFLTNLFAASVAYLLLLGDIKSLKRKYRDS